ncbi:N-acetylmuramic acid 6-phosphate etherase [Paracoccus siganidrum]|uniref:N-acetylmuramic acid 6-phosphate etherase n=1 Tax=Paracoccus siganidrum TaxID=1276757 RepID=A0A419A446_9RHOB|nr:N-acetylmuramic acid 6-phosphate etherase [Paracoccus siganidrum]RJL08945.1 N-acetylmuramic acid 6-phosphate etherase [Paracoccus siganidrum]RMC31113.1 N-acetylmuramic acid 6-phosphate etherase [Paracoccus siganidrum]
MTVRPTEARHSDSAGLHAQPAAQVQAVLLEAQVAALGSIPPAAQAIADAAEAGARALLGGGRMGYAGAGSSGLMAMADCLELSGTFGLPPERTPMLFAGGAAALLHMKGSVEDDAESAAEDVARAGLGQGDLLLVLSASGTTPYALAAARAAQARGVTVAGFANVAGVPLLELADIPVLLDTGAEVVAGSTRMGAATAQKVALNMLSVLVAIRLGHVHDGHMVNLVADNAKLIDRAARIVADVAQVPRPMAEAALVATDGAVKPAILVARGMDPAEAAAALSETGGHLAPLVD